MKTALVVIVFILLAPSLVLTRESNYIRIFLPKGS